jgi:hypothetical protein
MESWGYEFHMALQKNGRMNEPLNLAQMANISFYIKIQRTRFPIISI